MIEQIIIVALCLTIGVTIAVIWGVKTDKDNKKVCDKHYKEKQQ